ncbi:MAG: sigma-70 family RNA polymerase sigma factor [Lachnospiraceae bacterium]|nr:sigma-70 family RNA polymerase sigma factor [Parasporobacterium sp.]MBR4169004.1 sigma-70 family RNA polymerase sigma factor [Lachnospiraceae bacterium]
MKEQLSEQQETLYLEYHDKVFRLIMGKVNNEAVAQDLTSDVFVKVCAKLDTFDGNKASVSTWIYRIAQNTVIDYYRTRKVYAEVPEEIPYEGEIDDDLLNDEMLTELAEALKQLPERDRDLIILHYYRGMTLKEAAERIGMSYSNAKLVHNKSLVTLQRLLSKEE